MRPHHENSEAGRKSQGGSTSRPDQSTRLVTWAANIRSRARPAKLVQNSTRCPLDRKKDTRGSTATSRGTLGLRAWCVWDVEIFWRKRSHLQGVSAITQLSRNSIQDVSARECRRQIQKLRLVRHVRCPVSVWPPKENRPEGDRSCCIHLVTSRRFRARTLRLGGLDTLDEIALPSAGGHPEIPGVPAWWIHQQAERAGRLRPRRAGSYLRLVLGQGVCPDDSWSPPSRDSDIYGWAAQRVPVEPDWATTST